jgi:hypothetical protein
MKAFARFGTTEAVELMLKFLVTLEAKPGSKLTSASTKPLAGYYQTLGVTARSREELVELVRAFIRQDLDSSLLEISEMWVPEFEGRDSDIKVLCSNLDAVGIWYSSGRAWYSDDTQREES